MNQLLEMIEFVARAVWQVWPLFLVSIVLSVLVRALKLDGLIRRAFNTHVGMAILLATFVGAFSPFCSCTVVPVIAGLLLSGVPLAPIMSFWVASPTMDPEIFALSVGILGWPLALARLIATLGISLAAGYLTLALTHRSQLVAGLRSRIAPWLSAITSNSRAMATYQMAPAAAELAPSNSLSYAQVQVCDNAGCGSANVQEYTEARKPTSTALELTWRQQVAASWQQLNWGEFGADVARQSWSLGRWLLLAFVLEAIITSVIPQAAIAGLVGNQNRLAVPMAALIGIPLYLNNITALPIVAGLLAQGMQPGAAIAFLIAGPVTTIPAMTAVYGTVEKRIFAWYLGIGLLGAMFMGWATNWFLG